MLVSAYYMLQRDEPYREVGNDWFHQRHADVHTRRLVAQLKALGTPWSKIISGATRSSDPSWSVAGKERVELRAW
jgi:hypothetical protein